MINNNNWGDKGGVTRGDGTEEEKKEKEKLEKEEKKEKEKEEEKEEKKFLRTGGHWAHGPIK